MPPPEQFPHPFPLQVLSPFPGLDNLSSLPDVRFEASSCRHTILSDSLPKVRTSLASRAKATAYNATSYVKGKFRYMPHYLFSAYEYSVLQAAYQFGKPSSLSRFLIHAIFSDNKLQKVFPSEVLLANVYQCFAWATEQTKAHPGVDFNAYLLYGLLMINGFYEFFAEPSLTYSPHGANLVSFKVNQFARTLPVSSLPRIIYPRVGNIAFQTINFTQPVTLDLFDSWVDHPDSSLTFNHCQNIHNCHIELPQGIAPLKTLEFIAPSVITLNTFPRFEQLVIDNPRALELIGQCTSDNKKTRCAVLHLKVSEPNTSIYKVQHLAFDKVSLTVDPSVNKFSLNPLLKIKSLDLDLTSPHTPIVPNTMLPQITLPKTVTELRIRCDDLDNPDNFNTYLAAITNPQVLPKVIFYKKEEYDEGSPIFIEKELTINPLFTTVGV